MKADLPLQIIIRRDMLNWQRWWRLKGEDDGSILSGSGRDYEAKSFARKIVFYVWMSCSLWWRGVWIDAFVTFNKIPGSVISRVAWRCFKLVAWIYFYINLSAIDLILHPYMADRNSLPSPVDIAIKLNLLPIMLSFPFFCIAARLSERPINARQIRWHVQNVLPVGQCGRVLWSRLQDVRHGQKRIYRF